MKKLLLLSAILLILPLVLTAGDQPAVGSKAPGFNLQDQNGDWHKLEDYSGKWLAV